MKLNKLLEKQVRKFLPDDLAEGEKMQLFLNAVNDSYNAYERDMSLAGRALKKSKEECDATNNKLNSQISQNKASIDKLKEAIGAAGEDILAKDSGAGELLQIAEYLKKNIGILRGTEKKVHDQKLFYEQILNRIPADIAIMDKDHRYLFVNPQAIKDPALREWVIGKTDEEYMSYRNRPLSDSIERRKYFDATLKAGTQTEWEEKIVTPDGGIVYQLRVLYPVFDERGELDIMVIYGVNITERKKAEEKTKLSEARYKSIFNNGQALICTHDMNGILIDVNNASMAAFGYGEEELKGAPLAMLLPADKRADFENSYMKEITEKGKASGIMVALNRQGKKIYLLYQNYLVTGETEEPYVIGFSQDITPRIEAERAMKISEEKYRSIIANMNLGLVEVDNDEHIVYANNSFCEMSGYDADELIGKKPWAVFFIEERDSNSEEVAKRRKEGQSDAYELKVKNKKGESKWWLISGAPSYDNNGNLKGSIGIHLDITLQKNLERDLRKAKSDTERSAHAKEVFLANMSHEIRTPMNAILGIGRLLGKTTLEGQQQLYLATIQDAANNLLVLINDLLDFSKIEAGKVSLEHIGFELNAVLQNAVQVQRYKAEEKGLSLSYRASPDIVAVLKGDPYRINQVLMNLLSNSIKFTEKGEVKIECSLVEDDGDRQTIQFKVTDTGIGINKDFVAHLFDKFTQEDESVTRKFGGTGLGMSICKQLIDLMGGEIKVESKKNTGTSISFILRFPKGSAEDLPDRQQIDVDTQVLKGKRILLVEDNETNRLLANTILSYFGAQVTEAEDGSVAIKKLENGVYDLVLMDVMMPVKDGLEATRYIRKRIDSNIPIIAMTANAMKKEEERCIKAGMNDFISKPYDEHKLVQLVAQWLGREVKIQSYTKPRPAEAGPLFSLDKIQSIAREDKGFIKRMLELFIETTPQAVVEMQAAYEKNDLATVSALAHRTKPSIHNLYIHSLTDDIKALEHQAGIPADQLQRHLDRLKSVTDEVVSQLKAILPEYN